MFHFLHTVGVKHFDLVHDVLIHDAVHIGEGDAVPRCEGGQLAEMALVVVRRNDQITSVREEPNWRQGAIFRRG